MEEWHRNRTHVEVQDQARQKWGKAYYIRKGRVLSPDEPATGQVLCETEILREAQFPLSYAAGFSGLRQASPGHPGVLHPGGEQPLLLPWEGGIAGTTASYSPRVRGHCRLLVEKMDIEEIKKQKAKGRIDKIKRQKAKGKKQK